MIDLNQLYPTQIAYWAKYYVTILMRAAQWVTYQWGLHIQWPSFILANCQFHQKCQFQDSQNKDRLSAYRILLLQWTPKLGCTKPSTGPHAGHGWT